MQYIEKSKIELGKRNVEIGKLKSTVMALKDKNERIQKIMRQKPGKQIFHINNKIKITRVNPSHSKNRKNENSMLLKNVKDVNDGLFNLVQEFYDRLFKMHQQRVEFLKHNFRQIDQQSRVIQKIRQFEIKSKRNLRIENVGECS